MTGKTANGGDNRRSFLSPRRIALLAVVGSLLTAPSCRWVETYYLAGRDFRQQDYPYSIIRYQKFLEEYRKPTVRREVALINLGRSYMEMRAYRDAEKAFRQYGDEFPQGRFLDAANESLAEIRRTSEDRQKKLASEIAGAQKEAERLQGELAKKPADPELLVALGNAYWKIGQFKSAGESYLRAIESDPKLRSNPLLLERLIFDLNGNLIPISSAEQRIALEREREPLVLENVHDYTSRGVDDFNSSARRFYMVTGSVRNRSTRPILGVRVEITLYDPLGQILEVGTASIGTLYPQESRPFVVRSGLDAEAMGNISRYQSQALFQQ